MNKGKKLFVDTDCLSCFLFTNNGSLIQRVFPDYEIKIPHAVASEIEKNRSHIQSSVKKRTIIRNYDFALQNQHFSIMEDFESDSYEFEMVMKLCGKGFEGGPSVGIGEAEVITAAYCCDVKAMSSNNLKDVSYYVSKLHIQNWTAADILYRAYEMSLETENTIETLWIDLVNNDYKMPDNTFAEFKARKEK